MSTTSSPIQTACDSQDHVVEATYFVAAGILTIVFAIFSYQARRYIEKHENNQGGKSASLLNSNNGQIDLTSINIETRDKQNSIVNFNTSSKIYQNKILIRLCFIKILVSCIILYIRGFVACIYFQNSTLSLITDVLDMFAVTFNIVYFLIRLKTTFNKIKPLEVHAIILYIHFVIVLTIWSIVTTNIIYYYGTSQTFSYKTYLTLTVVEETLHLISLLAISFLFSHKAMTITRENINNINRFGIKNELDFDSIRSSESIIKAATKQSIILLIDGIFLLIFTIFLLIQIFGQGGTSSQSSQSSKETDMITALANAFRTLIIGLTLWLTFEFANKEYQCLFGKCGICWTNCYHYVAVKGNKNHTPGKGYENENENENDSSNSHKGHEDIHVDAMGAGLAGLDAVP